MSVDNDQNFHIAKRLALLIENQRGLKNIFISRSKFISVLIQPLIKQKKTLRQIIFRGIDFQGCGRLDVIRSCHKLEKLDLVDCYNLDFPMIAPLINHRSLQQAGIRNCSPANVGDELKSWAYKINCRKRKYF